VVLRVAFIKREGDKKRQTDINVCFLSLAMWQECPSLPQDSASKKSITRCICSTWTSRTVSQNNFQSVAISKSLATENRLIHLSMTNSELEVSKVKCERVQNVANSNQVGRR
jgi:hypothetical protein